MFKVFLVLLLSFLTLNGKILVGHNFPIFTKQDQFKQIHKPTKNTKQVIFVFSKSMAHLTKEYFDTLEPDFLAKRDTLFVADVSSMPAIIRYFVLDDLVVHKYPIILIEDDKTSKHYKEDDSTEKIMIVSLDKLKVVNKQYITTIKELKEILK